MQIKSVTSLVFACVFAIGAGSAVAAQDADNTGKSGKPLGACPQGTRCNEHGFCIRLET